MKGGLDFFFEILFAPSDWLLPSDNHFARKAELGSLVRSSSEGPGALNFKKKPRPYFRMSGQIL
jgi:hypothetical protein